MKKLFTIKKVLTTAALSLIGVMLFGLGMNAKVSAACMQFDPNSTLSTPVFNNFCNAPNGIGNENDFVRIRQSSNGDDTDNINNPHFSDPLSAACSAGDKFDIWTYIHNDAASGFNNNGAGTSVAHNVKLNLEAQLNVPKTSFTFTSTVTATNAVTAKDTATLNCGNKTVKLTLVPTSVHTYSQQYGGWKDLNGNVVNGGAFAIGSPTLGSGDFWACFEYREVVVYQVEVKEIPQEQPQSLTCSLLELSAIDTKSRKLHAKVTGTTQNGATITGYKIEWGDNGFDSVQEGDHTFADFNKEYTITGTVTGTVNGQPASDSNANCVKKITFTKENCTVKGKENLPKDSPDCKEVVVTKLVNTGPADTLGIFTGTSILGAFAHRLRTLRKLGRR